MSEPVLKSKHIRDKMRRFCEEFVVDCNGKEAAIRAGYSAKTAKGKAGVLMTDERVQEYIAYLKKQVSEKLELKKEDNINMLDRIAKTPLPVFFKINQAGVMEFKRFEEIPEELHVCIESLEQKFDNFGNPLTIKAKFYSRLKAQELLNKMMGWDAPEQVEHSGEIELVVNYVNDED